MTFDASRRQPLQNHRTMFVLYSRLRASASFFLQFLPPLPILSATLPAPLPLSPMQVGLRGLLCCLICTAHSCSFIIVPLAAKALFFGQTMGGVVTESTVVMSHLPSRAISLSYPPSHPTRCPPFNSTLILLHERKTWELSIHPKPPRPQLYTYY